MSTRSSVVRTLVGSNLLRAVGLPDWNLGQGVADVVVGALPHGTASYSYPGTAVFVSTTGSDAAAGTEAAPKRTLAAAISAAPSGGTIVIRGGEYRENAGQTSKSVTIQNYPGEAVWFDGTDVETAWTQEGALWWAPITVEFSHIAGHSQEAPDDPTRWTDSQNPLAHYTDLCFIDGARQWQVASNPAAGQFSVDYGTNRIYIAVNPSGKEVRVAKRTKMLHVSAPCTIRGIGWRRYATEMWELGTVYVATAGAGSVVEHCHMVDVATQPLAVIGPDTIARYNTIVRPGQLGVHVNRADRCEITHNVIREHNWEKFKTEPHAGGIKVTFTGDAIIEWNWVDGASNRGMSIWFDASCWGGRIVNNYTSGGYGGVFTEATGNMIVAGNWMFGNASSYFAYRNTIAQQIKVWNNYGNTTDGYTFAFWQDNREAVFPGERFWDEGLRWHVKQNELVNNVMGGAHELYLYYQRKDSNAPAAVVFDDMVTRLESNYFASTPGQSPPTGNTRLAGLEPGTGVVNYTTLSSFETAHATAAGNFMTGLQAPTAQEMAGFTGAVPLPADVAAAVGVAAGLTVIGPPLPAPIPREA